MTYGNDHSSDAAQAIRDERYAAMDRPRADPTPMPAADDVWERAMAIIRTEIESVNDMTDEDRRRVATPQNQAVWIMRSLVAAGLAVVDAGDASHPS